MDDKKIIYYADELNDEFSTAKIDPITIDEKYKYIHKNPLWDFCSFLLQNFLSMPIKLLYAKLKFKIKYIGKEKIRPYKKDGYFIYVNHTQEFADTFIPSIPIYPKRNFFIVNPENVSMKYLKTVVPMLGALPLPDNKQAMQNFLEAINQKIKKGYSITIYPEAHIWPYYTKVRPFRSVSFRYPIQCNAPVFCMTNTYHKRGDDKVKIITYIDGPFYKDENLKGIQQKEELRNRIYNCMAERSKNSTFEYIKYEKIENSEKLSKN